MPARSLYEILQVSPSAHPAVIEAAYRALMKRHHPDQAGAAGDAPLAVIINDAYAVLRNPDRRAEYDRRVDSERRDRAARIASLGGPSPSPKRGINLFGWSGWLVALAVTAVLTAVERPAAPILSAAAPTEVEPWNPARSQPDPSTLDAGPVEPPLTTGSAVATTPSSAADAQAAIDPVPPPAAARASRPRADRTARAQQRPQPRAGARQRDAEFLEREGYIY